MKTKRKIKIAIVEDDKFYNKALTRYIELETQSIAKKYNIEIQIQSFLSASESIENLDDDLNIMFLDYFFSLPENDENLTGLDVLKETKKHAPNCFIIILSELKDVFIAVELMKNGVYDYLNKELNSRNRIGSILHDIIKMELSENFPSKNSHLT